MNEKIEFKIFRKLTQKKLQNELNIIYHIALTDGYPIELINNLLTKKKTSQKIKLIIKKLFKPEFVNL